MMSASADVQRTFNVPIMMHYKVAVVFMLCTIKFKYSKLALPLLPSFDAIDDEDDNSETKRKNN